jgi:predicted ester cyclase
VARRHSALGERADPLAGHNDAFAARQPRRLAESFTPDAVFDFKPFEAPAVGRDEIETTYRLLFDAFPDLRSQRIRRFVRGDEAVEELLLLGTHRGRILGTAGSGRPVSVRARLVFKLRDGQIARLDAYVDTPSLLMQIGAPQSNRYADAGAVAASNLMVDLAAAPVDDVEPLAAPPSPPPAAAPAGLQRPGGRRRLLLAVAPLVLAAGVGAWLFFGRTTAQPQPAATPSPSALPSPLSSASPSITASTLAPSPVPRTPQLAVGTVDLLAAAPATIVSLEGKPVVVHGARVVQAAPRDGIWVGVPGHEFWVELADEVPFNPKLPFRTGEVVSFVGTLVANSPAFVADVHVDQFVDARTVLSQGYHINADYRRISVG